MSFQFLFWPGSLQQWAGFGIGMWSQGLLSHWWSAWEPRDILESEGIIDSLRTLDICTSAPRTQGKLNTRKTMLQQSCCTEPITYDVNLMWTGQLGELAP